MTAIDRLDKWLRISPSTVLPAEVLEYLDDIKDENVKLRAERDEWHRVAQSKQDIIDHMRDATAENAKLRELCVDYDKVLDIAIRGYVGIDKPLLIGANQTALRSRMYGLGIEVDG